MGPIQTLNTQRGETTKRFITLVDDSNMSIQCTLWGKSATVKADCIEIGKPVAIKGVKISTYNGKTLSASDYCEIICMPDHHRTVELSKWFENEYNS